MLSSLINGQVNPLFVLQILLVVGTKLQGIITKMCLDTSDKSHVIRGTLLVRPSDHFFWFDRPNLLLHLMHLILFQVSFDLSPWFCMYAYPVMNSPAHSENFLVGNAELVSTGILHMVLGEY